MLQHQRPPRALGARGNGSAGEWQCGGMAERAGMQNGPPLTPGWAILFGWVRRRPTLPHPPGCSTIGAGGLSFRVRDETGRFPFAVATETTVSGTPVPDPCVGGGWLFVCCELHSGRVEDKVWGG